MVNFTSNSSTSGTTTGIIISQYFFYSLIVVSGLIGNVLVFKAIFAQKRRRINEFFILNLVITDLGTCSLSIPLDVIEQITKRFLFGSFLCRIIYPLQTIFMSTSVLTLLCLSLERYKAIVLPLQPKLRPKTVKRLMVGSWILSILLVVPYIRVLEYKDEQCQENWPSNPLFVQAYTFGVFLILYLVPLLIITACYSRVLFRLYMDKSQVVRLMGGKRSSLDKLIRRRAEQNLRMVRLCVTAVIAFALCLLPFHVLWLWHDFGKGGEDSNFSTMLRFSNILVYSNSVINPLIFGKLNLRQCCRKNLDGNVFFSLRSYTTGSFELSSFRSRSRSNAQEQMRDYAKPRTDSLPDKLISNL